MAQITNFTVTSWASEQDAWTNGPAAVSGGGANIQTVYFDDQDVSSGQTDPTLGVLETGDILYVDAGFVGILNGGDNYYYYEVSSVGYVVQVAANGVVGAPTTTTTTTAPPPVSYTYTISIQDGNGATISSINEGSTFNVVVTVDQAGQNETLTATGAADESDFTTWPFGAGNTSQVLDFSSLTTQTLTFVIDNDTTTEGNQDIIFTLDDGTTETLTIIDSSVTNQPPTLGNGSFNVTQNNNNDFVNIDLSDPSLANDPENDPMTWTIVSGPNNGYLIDPNAPATQIANYPHVIANSAAIIRYYPDNTGAPSTTTFDFKAEDQFSTQTNTATITVSIDPPSNQPPEFVSGLPTQLTTQANGAGSVLTFTRNFTDEDPLTCTLEWLDVNGNVLANPAGVNATLNYGVLSGSDQTGWAYTTNAQSTLNPGQPDLIDNIYFKVTDSAGENDTHDIEFRHTAPGNIAPTWDVTPPSTPQEITAGVQFNVTGITASDPDQSQTLTYTLTLTGSDSNAAGSFNEQTDTLSITGAAAGNVVATLEVSDGIGSDTIVYNFNTVEVAYRGVNYSPFSNSETTACGLTRSTGSDFYYYSTGTNGATFLSNIQPGAKLYYDFGLQNPVTPSSNSNTWISLEETTYQTVKAVKLDTDGTILEILNCTVSSGNAWPLYLRYSQVGEGSIEENYCNDIYEEGEAWQNAVNPANNGGTATLADVVAAGGQLFSSEYSANQYVGQTAPTGVILAEGLYSEPGVTQDGSYYYYNSGWVNINGNTLFDCPAPITYSTKNIDVYFYAPNPTNIGDVCNANIGPTWADSIGNYTQITLYYRQDVNDANNWSLLDLAKNQVQVFLSQSAAESQNYTLLASSAILLDGVTGGFVIWDNNEYTGYDGSYVWYAVSDDFNSSTQDNILELADAGSVLGSCGDGVAGADLDYTRPSLWNDLDIQIGNSTGSRTSVYYAFYGCNAKLDPGIPGGKSYYPMYIVDGMVDVAQMSDDGISYINDFVKQISNRIGTTDERAQIKVGGECLTYMSYIVATNIEDAVAQMKIEIEEIESNISFQHGGLAIPVRPVSINAIDLGFGSQATVTWRNFTDLEKSTICYSCSTQVNGTQHPWTSYTFPAMDDNQVLDRTIPNFDLEENYVLDGVSKPLLRTNPKLTTNAKIVANISDEIFLESIDATKDLASVEYKRWALNPNGDYSQDLYKFYKSSSTPADVMYAVRSDYSDFTVQDSFSKQIEEVYHYGTTYNYSKLHDEDFRMFAPIWLDKDIPKKFVVFRVNDPVGEIDFDANNNLQNIQDILKNSEIIKTFDLTDDSSLGKYIRGHVNSESFPKTPVQFNFERREKSNFKGIDLGKGGFATKGEYLYKDFVRADSPLIAQNAMITDGFERNKLACANLLNLEFLFNDNEAADYTINRYFGLYVNDIDSGYGNISSADNGNIIFKNLNSYINESPESAIPAFKQISGTPTLGYLNISDEFYKISSKAKYDVNKLNVIVEDSKNQIPLEVKTAPNGNSVDLVKDDRPGYDFVKFSVIDTPAVNDMFTVFESRESVYSLKFLRHIPNESWQLSINNGGTQITAPIQIQGSIYSTFQVIQTALSSFDNINVEFDGDKTIFIQEVNATLGDLEVYIYAPVPSTVSSIIKVTQMQSSINLDSSTFFAASGAPGDPAYLAPGKFSGNSFSPAGSTSDIANAIVSCINNSSINFDAVIQEGSSDFYIKSRVSGYKLLQSGVFVPTNNSMVFLSIENRDIKTVNNPQGVLKLSDVVLDNNFVYFMKGGNSPGKSVLVTQDSVADIVIGDMIPTNSIGVYNEVIDIVDDIENTGDVYSKLILDKKNSLESGEHRVYAENVARLGLLSAYDIHDMNFDFYDIENSELKELELETPENINYEPERSASNSLTVFSSDYDIEDPYSYFSGISATLGEETLDEYNEIKLFSEYDRLQENSLKEFAVDSRVVPSINKWVLKDSLTVREQPYYLNSNEAFGRTNFSPDFDAVGRDRLGMTHEWFYMDNLPKYITNDKLNSTFSYVNFVDGFELKPSHFKSTSYNYFDKFMVTDGFEVKDEYGIKSFIKTNLQKKYSLISGGNNVSFADTIFKGIKVGFKNRKEFEDNKSNEFVKTSEFNGYKFSTLLLVRGGSNSNDIEYEVIQNKAFKFVIFLITVSIDDLWIDGALNRKLLYEMNHSFVWNNETRSFKYSDVELSGAINLNDINFTNPNSDDYRVAFGINHVNGSKPQFLDQINPDEDNNFGEIEITVTDSSGSVTFRLGIESVDDQGQITLSSNPTDLNGNPVNISNISGYIQNSAEYVYKQGGKNAFTSILDQLSVGSVAQLLELNDGSITYTTIEEDGTSLNNRFELEFENGVEIIKDANLVTVPDQDKPKTFKLKQGIIGFNLYGSDTYYPFLVRHNGNYTVDTRPVVTFTDTYSHFKTNTLQTTTNAFELNIEEPMYKHSLTSAEEIKLARDYYKKYNRCGTSFNLGFIQDNTHDSQWGIIKNHFYRKVNESNASGVTKLSRSTDKLPLYPLIGEVAIDKKDVNVFKSSWDKNYYTRSLSGGITEDVPGTFETKEERSYLGSTIMKVKDSYNILQFSSKQVFSQEEQDSILANDNNTTDVVIFEDKKYVYVDFYISTTLNRLLSEDGVLNSINKFVAPVDSAGDKTTTVDDAILYVENNLANAFNLDIIKIYTSRIKGKYSEILSTENIENLDDAGFTNDTNFTFEAHEQKPLNFRLIYNKRLGYSYKIRPMIKIKS